MLPNQVSETKLTLKKPSDDVSILSQALALIGVEHLKRQHLNGYYFDFVFPTHKLVVEIKGKPHTHSSSSRSEQELYEQKRNDYLTQIGYKLVCYSSEALKYSVKGVALNIRRHLLTR
ncbi:MAG: DUF559 domain-containing protein [Chroococcidiopsidaceae cyanobacterium CP_BM_ER_R8_30]|nr:DUF559 domain-containing protein [Chroococcidiopsidaceae cyanobacterium CP_BM_ER_R8_30]